MMGTMADMTTSGHVLPDSLRPGLDIVFVGTAAGRRSAAVGAYYANRGNRFWRTLHEVGLTPKIWKPTDFPRLLDLGIGFTDLAKRASGMDHELRRADFDVAGLQSKLLEFRPRLVAFTSKKAGSIWCGVRSSGLELGLQSGTHAMPFDVHVLPSPSGAARRHWSVAPWHELARYVRETRP